jgi:mannosyltransferase
MPSMPNVPVSDDPDVLIFNWKRRISGVSATIAALVPHQQQTWRLWMVGEALPECPKPVSVWQAIKISWRKPKQKQFRIWHVRRDNEMLLAIVLQKVFRRPIRTVFTSSAQRRHSFFPRWLIRQMDAVIATTRFAADFLDRPTTIIPHGVDTARFSPTADRVAALRAFHPTASFAVGTAGRVRHDKGTDLFVDAMIALLPKCAGAIALIAGLNKPEDADYLAEMKGKVTAAKLEDRIIFLGEVPMARMPGFYQALSLFVASPRHEEFGLTPIEAMATGCAVVATRTGAFADMVLPGETGELVPVDDAEALGAAIVLYLDDPARMTLHGREARERVVAHFQIENEASRVGKVYQSLFD